MTETKEKKVAAKAPVKKAEEKAPVAKKAESKVDAPKASAAKKSSAPKARPSGPTIFVKRTGSPIRRDARQREYLKGLGLSKMNQVRELVDTPEVRGLVRKAQHMVQIVEKA